MRRNQVDNVTQPETFQGTAYRQTQKTLKYPFKHLQERRNYGADTFKEKISGAQNPRVG